MKSFAVFLIVCVGVALGHSRGAPDRACEKLTPIHEHAPNPQKSPVPYSLKVNAKIVQGGMPVRVTLSGGNNTANVFTGFMLQARNEKGSQGEFRVLDTVNSQVMQCKQAGDSITHKKINGPGIRSIEFEWIAPNSTGRVSFVGTVAKSYSEFWNNLKSESIEVY